MLSNENTSCELEAAVADKGAAEMYVEVLRKVEEEGGCITQQIFDDDETWLFRKKVPNRIYFSKEEKAIQGCKA
jgi:hypothetical protein